MDNFSCVLLASGILCVIFTIRIWVSLPGGKKMDMYTKARKDALINLINSRQFGLLRIGRGSVELRETLTSPLTSQYTCKHYNEIGKYTMLQFIEYRMGEFKNYHEVIY